MKKQNIEEFSDLRRPTIVCLDDLILISDPPIARRIFLVFFCFLLALIAFESDNGDSRIVGVVLALSLSLIFIYDSLSLKRIRIDLKEKVIHRKSINPLENLVGRLLQHPSKIPFSDIDKIFADYNVVFGGAKQRYFLYIRTSDPYKLNIGTFDKLGDAERVASYLTKIIRNG